MSDRFGFSSPSGRFGGTNPWFRIGNFDVTTTAAIVGTGLAWLFIWAAEGGHGRGGLPGPISKYLTLISKEGAVGSVPEGQIWRLVTWPVVNEPDIFVILLFAVFFMLGTQIENLMGRKPYLWFVGLLTVVPAVMVSLLEILIPGFLGSAFGLRFVEIGVLVAFAAQYPTARFWPGIPAWVIAAVIVGIDFLQVLGNRNDYQFTMLFFTVGVSLVAFRSFGYATEVAWIPKIALPASVTGQGGQSRSQHPGRQKRRRAKGRGNLSAVPKSPPTAERVSEAEIDRLLDQVAAQGLDSLSKSQRKSLEDHSKRLRKRRGQG